VNSFQVKELLKFFPIFAYTPAIVSR